MAPSDLTSSDFLKGQTQGQSDFTQGQSDSNASYLAKEPS